MASLDTEQNRRKSVAAKYGHPWLWQVRELVEKFAVDSDVDLRLLADRWGIRVDRLTEWVRRHGFRTEDYQAKRRES